MRRTFVSGGTAQEGDDMGKPRALSDRQAEAMYTQYVMGEGVADLAAAYGIGKSTASRYIADMRKKKEAEREGNLDMASKSKIVAGDKRNGRLTSTPDPHRYEGTCVVNGKAHSKTFVTVNAKKAEELWRKWCQDLADEQAFMDMVERKVDAVVEEAEGAEGVVEVEMAPVPDIPVTPWREVAEQRERELEALREELAEAKRAVEYLTGRVEGYESESTYEKVPASSDQVVADTELDEPKLGSWFNNNGSFAVVWRDKPVYLLWAKGEQPRCYGVYQHSEGVLKDADRLNEMASFLGHSDAFEIEEVQWR